MKKLILVLWLFIGVASFSSVSFKDIQLGMSKEAVIEKVGSDNYQPNNFGISYNDIEINGIKMKKVQFLFLFNNLYSASFDMKSGNMDKVFNLLDVDFGKALEMKSNKEMKLGIYNHIYSKKVFLLMAEDKKTKEGILNILYEKELNDVIKKLKIFRN